MKASVIIPTYNRSEILKYTLSSLIGQDIGIGEYEVIVVDDGSSDNTREVVEAFKDKLSLVYYFQEDKGFRAALARNEGIRRAKGEVLIFLDTGMIVGSSFVREHYNAHFGDVNSNEKYAVIGYVFGFDPKNESEDVIPEAVDFSRPNETMQRLKKLPDFFDVREKLYLKINDDLSSIPAPWAVFFSTNVSVERGVMIEAGCFDEEYITWGLEDVECAYRLFKNKVKFKLSREACGVHYPHERHNTENFISNGVNQRKFYNKHHEDAVELFISTNVVRFNEEYMEYLAFRDKTGDRKLYSKLLTEEATESLSEVILPSKNIVLGCQDGFLLKVCKSQAATESDMNLIVKAKEANPGVEIRQSLGIRTYYSAKTFETCLIAGSGQLLLEPFITKLVREASRISRKVYWLKSGEPDVAGYTCTKVKDLENGFVLYHIEKDPDYRGV